MNDIKHFNSVKEMRAFMRGKGEQIVPTEFKLEDLQPKGKTKAKVDDADLLKKATKEKKPAPKKKGGKK